MFTKLLNNTKYWLGSLEEFFIKTGKHILLLTLLLFINQGYRDTTHTKQLTLELNNSKDYQINSVTGKIFKFSLLFY